jgi:hypothetical protein
MLRLLVVFCTIASIATEQCFFTSFSQGLTKDVDCAYNKSLKAVGLQYNLVSSDADLIKIDDTHDLPACDVLPLQPGSLNGVWKNGSQHDTTHIQVADLHSWRIPLNLCSFRPGRHDRYSLQPRHDHHLFSHHSICPGHHIIQAKCFLVTCFVGSWYLTSSQDVLYEPEKCSVRRITGEGARRCFRGKRVSVVGDSIMVHTLRAMLRVINNIEGRRPAQWCADGRHDALACKSCNLLASPAYSLLDLQLTSAHGAGQWTA